MLEGIKNWRSLWYEWFFENNYKTVKEKLENSPIASSLLYEPALRWHSYGFFKKSFVLFLSIAIPLALGAVFASPIVAAVSLFVSSFFLVCVGYENRLIDKELSTISKKNADPSIEQDENSLSYLKSSTNTLQSEHEAWEHDHDLLNVDSWELEKGLVTKFLKSLPPELGAKRRTEATIKLSKNAIEKSNIAIRKAEESRLDTQNHLIKVKTDVLSALSGKEDLPSRNLFLSKLSAIKKKKVNSPDEILENLLKKVPSGSKTNVQVALSQAIRETADDTLGKRKKSLIETNELIARYMNVYNTYSNPIVMPSYQTWEAEQKKIADKNDLYIESVLSKDSDNEGILSLVEPAYERQDRLDFEISSYNTLLNKEVGGASSTFSSQPFIWTFHVRSVNDLMTFCKDNLVSLLAFFQAIEKSGIIVICKASTDPMPLTDDFPRKSFSREVLSTKGGMLDPNITNVTPIVTQNKWQLIFDSQETSVPVLDADSSTVSSTKKILEASVDRSNSSQWRIEIQDQPKKEASKSEQKDTLKSEAKPLNTARDLFNEMAKLIDDTGDDYKALLAEAGTYQERQAKREEEEKYCQNVFSSLRA